MRRGTAGVDFVLDVGKRRGSVTSDTGILSAQQLGQRIGPGTRPALLVVDLVNGFLDPEMFGGGNCEDAARAAGAPVVFTRIAYADDGSDRGVWCL